MKNTYLLSYLFTYPLTYLCLKSNHESLMLRVSHRNSLRHRSVSKQILRTLLKRVKKLIKKTTTSNPSSHMKSLAGGWPAKKVFSTSSQLEDATRTKQCRQHMWEIAVFSAAISAEWLSRHCH